MKTLTNALTIVLTLVISISSIAQSPNSFKYQAVIRDNSGTPLVNQGIGVKLSILSSSSSGTVEYSEEHTVTTSDYGVIALNVGEGSVLSGNFSNIDWGGDSHFLKVEMDLSGGTNYNTPLGTTQLLSVPYALNARSVENSIWTVSGNDISYSQGMVGIGNTSALSSASGELNVAGEVDGYSSNGIRKFRLFSGGTSSPGSMGVFGPNGNENAGLTSNIANSNYGALTISNNLGDHKITASIRSPANVGFLLIEGANGSENIALNSSDPNVGWIGIKGSTSQDIFRISQFSGVQGGAFEAFGPNGNANIAGAALSGFDNNGYLAVLDASGTIQAGMYVSSTGDGIVFGDTKNFRMDHPSKPGKEIWYASLEGPEAGAYCRGTTSLINGYVQVPLPNHFAEVANVEDMTVTLTPLSLESKGLAVTAKEEGYIVVQELHGGKGNYDFDWEVKSVRKGYENYQVVRDASDVNMQPSNPSVDLSSQTIESVKRETALDSESVEGSNQ